MSTDYYRWISPFHARSLQGQNYQRFILKGKLTDKAIARYVRKGRLRFRPKVKAVKKNFPANSTEIQPSTVAGVV